MASPAAFGGPSLAKSIGPTDLHADVGDLDDLFADTQFVAPCTPGAPQACLAAATALAAQAPQALRAAHSVTGETSLPEIDAPPGMAPSAVKAARTALVQGFRPDMCKLCVVEPKLGKSTFCRGCRRKVEACEYQAKMADMREGDGTPHMDKIESLKAAKDSTQLRLLIFDFEAKTNPDGNRGGRGQQTRSTYDFVQYKEYTKCSQLQDHMDVIKPLTRFRFLEYFTEEEGMTPAEALQEWEQRLQGDTPRDWKGRNGEVRLDTKVDEVKMHGSRKEKANTLEGHMKPKRAPKEGDIDAMMDNLMKRHSKFTGDFWDSGLEHVPGARIDTGFDDGGDIIIGADKKRKIGGTGTAVASTSASSFAEGDTPPSKIMALKDRESKLNKMRNDLTDLVNEQQKVCEDLVAHEAGAMRSALNGDEVKQADYSALLSTFDIRLFALELVSSREMPAAKLLAGFNQLGFLKVTAEKTDGKGQPGSVAKNKDQAAEEGDEDEAEKKCRRARMWSRERARARRATRAQRTTMEARNRMVMWLRAWSPLRSCPA